MKMLLHRTLMLLACSAQIAAAQSPQPVAVTSKSPASPADSAPEIPDARLFHRSDLYVLSGFVAGTIAMFPLDRHMASVIRDEDLTQNKRIDEVARAFRFFGASGPYLIGGSMYAVGRLAGIHRAADLGLHGTEALVVGQTLSGVLKAMLGRARPYLSSDTNAHNFAFARGLKGGQYQSFPSGHATTAFAAAAAVSAETSEWWPRTKWIIGPILFGGATMVGVSRIYHDRHWASDVVMGAAVGTFAGLKTVRFNKTHTGNRLDRFFLGKGGGSSGPGDGGKGSVKTESLQIHLSLTPNGSPAIIANWQW